MYRDVSYIIIKQIENQNLGIKMKSMISDLIEHGMSVLFVNDIDLFSDSDEVEEKI